MKIHLNIPDDLISTLDTLAVSAGLNRTQLIVLYLAGAVKGDKPVGLPRVHPAGAKPEAPKRALQAESADVKRIRDEIEALKKEDPLRGD